MSYFRSEASSPSTVTGLTLVSCPVSLSYTQVEGKGNPSQKRRVDLRHPTDLEGRGSEGPWSVRVKYPYALQSHHTWNQRSWQFLGLV